MNMEFSDNDSNPFESGPALLSSLGPMFSPENEKQTTSKNPNNSSQRSFMSIFTSPELTPQTQPSLPPLPPPLTQPLQQTHLPPLQLDTPQFTPELIKHVKNDPIDSPLRHKDSPHKDSSSQLSSDKSHKKKHKHKDDRHREHKERHKSKHKKKDKERDRERSHRDRRSDESDSGNVRLESGGGMGNPIKLKLSLKKPAFGEGSDDSSSKSGLKFVIKQERTTSELNHQERKRKHSMDDGKNNSIKRSLPGESLMGNQHPQQAGVQPNAYNYPSLKNSYEDAHG
jgi:hypothetical protein